MRIKTEFVNTRFSADELKITLKTRLRMLLGMTCLVLPLSLSAQQQQSFHQVGASNPSNQYLDVPDIGGNGIGLLNQQQERLIGEKVLREVRAQLPMLNDVWLEEEILQVFKSIYGQTGLGQPLALVVVKDAQINAFAVPGGLFAINTGLLTSSRNMDEVAGVVAHEIAHVTQRHYSRSKEAFKGQGLLSLAGLLAGMVVASQAPDVGAAVMMGSQAALMDQQLTYSRNQEREADRVGMQYMSIAGYNPISMADFFETMHRKSVQISFLPDFWLTHPLTTERMSEARLRARQFPIIKDNAIEKQEKFELIRWRAAVLSGTTTRVQLEGLAPRNQAAGLALATYYIHQSEFDDAKRVLDHIKPNESQKTLYDLTLADWYKAQQHYQQALAILLPLYQIAPESKLLAIQVADLYILMNKAEDGFKLANALSQRFPRDTMIWHLMQRAEILRQNKLTPINVLRYKAEYEFWRGNEEEAIKSLLHAQRLVKIENNEFLQQKIASRLNQMQDAKQLKL